MNTNAKSLTCAGLLMVMSDSVVHEVHKSQVRAIPSAQRFLNLWLHFIVDYGPGCLWDKLNKENNGNYEGLTSKSYLSKSDEDILSYCLQILESVHKYVRLSQVSGEDPPQFYIKLKERIQSQDKYRPAAMVHAYTCSLKKNKPVISKSLNHANW